MDRFRWSTGKLNIPIEESVHTQRSVSIYNLEERTAFNSGQLQVTSHRLLWHDPNDARCIIELGLNQIVGVELKQAQRVAATRQSSNPRILLQLEKETVFTDASLVDSSLTRAVVNPYVQLEFEHGGHNEFKELLNQQLVRKRWIHTHTGLNSQHTGISGIQKKLQDRLDQQDQQITDSFKDLGILINQAKEMVTLSNVLIEKLGRDKAAVGGNADSEDMHKLKGYFANMGIIDSPVTKETSGSKYFADLAAEISHNLTQAIVEHGGIMTLSDVYCRLNRARATAGLISADDLLNACKHLNKLVNQKLRYNVYADLNLHVLEVETLHNQQLDEICRLTERHEHLTAYSLSRLLSCSLIVARKHLLDGERMGRLCRDDTSSGLRFFKNLFLLN